MLSFDCYKSRMEQGLTFIEFNYMLLQAYDYYVLHNRLGCNIQCGGDDQWANMIAGTELIRRKLGHDAQTLTVPLILTSDGTKMGKTAKGALWLDAERTSPFEFYQYFRNVSDADAVSFMKRLTFVPLDEIASEYEGLKGSETNRAKERLAYEITALIHGEKAAEEARDVSSSLFGAGVENENMPSTILTDIQDGISAMDLLVKCGLAPSKSDARRVIDQGGMTVNDVKVTSPSAVFSEAELKEGLIIKKGKKIFHKATAV
jgi:tyrosyl-tRNA synthetase